MTCLVIGWLGLNVAVLGMVFVVAFVRRNEPVQLDIYDYLESRR